MLRLVIAGGRDFKNYPLLKREVDIFIKELSEVMDISVIEIVSGKQVTKPDYNDPRTWHGADYLGERYAEEYGLKVVPFPADWKGPLGKGAGFARNEDMAKYGNASIVFWDGQSHGSQNMIKHSVNYNLKHKVVKY